MAQREENLCGADMHGSIHQGTLIVDLLSRWAGPQPCSTVAEAKLNPDFAAILWTMALILPF